MNLHVFLKLFFFNVSNEIFSEITCYTQKVKIALIVRKLNASLLKTLTARIFKI